MRKGHEVENNSPNVDAERWSEFFFLQYDFVIAVGHGMCTVNWGS